MPLPQTLVQKSGNLPRVLSPGTKCFVWSWAEDCLKTPCFPRSRNRCGPLCDSLSSYTDQWATSLQVDAPCGPPTGLRPRRGAPTTDYNTNSSVSGQDRHLSGNVSFGKEQISKPPFWKQSNSSILEMQSLKTKKQTMSLKKFEVYHKKTSDSSFSSKARSQISSRKLT